MASVEQREATHPAGLATLDLFDQFKVLDEDKDSDEESFHLPLLDSEEDLSSNKISSDTPVQNGESEDDILNKFDCVNTPEPLDPKVEDSILNEEIEDENADSKTVPKENEDKKEEVIQNKDETEVKENGLDENNKADEVECDIPKNEVNEEKDIVNISVEDINDNSESKESFEEIEAKNTKENEETSAEKNQEEAENQDDKMEVEDEEVEDEQVKKDKTVDVEENKEERDKMEEIVEVINENDNNMEIDREIINEEEKNNEEHNVVMQTDEMQVESSSKDSEKIESQATENIEISSTTADNEEEKAVEENVPQKEIEEIKDNPEEEETDKTETETTDVIMGESEDNSVELQKTSKDETVKEESKKTEDTTLQITEKDVMETDQKKTAETAECSSPKDTQDETENADSTSKAAQEGVKKTNESESKKITENDANDSANSENLERDDLLDISVICDVDEDNAKAVAENASEKSDNDDQDDKGENDIEESENDQEENVCSSDKDEAMESDDGVSNCNSNLQFEENSSTNDNVTVNNANEKINSDSNDSSDIGSNKEDVEMMDVLPKVIAGLTSSPNVKKSTAENIQTDEEKTENGTETSSNLPEEPVEYLDLDKHMAEQKKKLEITQSSKRPLSQGDEQGVTTKKIRLSESPTKGDNTKKLDGDEKLKTLTSFESFMRTKLFNKKLTKSDLEQFCIQKICEVIMHKTELGELHQLVKKQEQMNEQLRKDIQQLSKQARDLDIVNKKLMNELKSQNGKQKPLVPLKITRSVGLQVKLSVANEQARKRAPSTPNRQNSNSTTSSTSTPANNRQRTVPQNNTAVRQVAPNSAPSPRKPQQASGNTTPILSQALQTPASRQSTTPTNTAKRTPAVIRPKTADPAKPSNPGVIDLTDEDDRTTKTTAAANMKIISKQVVTSKLVAQKAVGKSPNNQNKIVNINQVKAGQVVNKGTPTRTVTTLPQGVRLTPTAAVKNGIAIPANVVTSSTGGTQLMYVVQPTSSLVTTTAQGGQKTVLLNFQPGNGILTSALNGSAVSVIPTKANVQVKSAPVQRKHPAPLPLPPPIQPNNNLKPLLPKPHLSIRKTETGIILQWRMPYNLDLYECIASYQLFAYQETNAAPSTDMWRKVGDVKALALPMACTLTQFADKNKYYFAVRSVDVHKRIGAFSDPEEISL